MMTAEEIQKALMDRKLGTVAERTGINRSTLWRIREGKTKSKPNFATLKVLADYLNAD